MTAIAVYTLHSVWHVHRKRPRRRANHTWARTADLLAHARARPRTQPNHALRNTIEEHIEQRRWERRQARVASEAVAQTADTAHLVKLGEQALGREAPVRVAVHLAGTTALKIVIPRSWSRFLRELSRRFKVHGVGSVVHDEDGAGRGIEQLRDGDVTIEPVSAPSPTRSTFESSTLTPRWEMGGGDGEEEGLGEVPVSPPVVLRMTARRTKRIRCALGSMTNVHACASAPHPPLYPIPARLPPLCIVFCARCTRIVHLI